MKFRGLNEIVGKLENDVIFLLSVDASSDCENEGGTSCGAYCC